MKLRIALIGVSHWHAPLYIDGLSRLGHKVIAISDENVELSVELNRTLNCTTYANYQDLVLNEKPDFAFAFGRHIDMPKIAEFLISEEIPFVRRKILCKAAPRLPARKLENRWLILIRVIPQEIKTRRKKIPKGISREVLTNLMFFLKINLTIQARLTARKTTSMR